MRATQVGRAECARHKPSIARQANHARPLSGHRHGDSQLNPLLKQAKGEKLTSPRWRSKAALSAGTEGQELKADSDRDRAVARKLMVETAGDPRNERDGTNTA